MYVKETRNRFRACVGVLNLNLSRASHPTPSLQSPPTTRGGMAHEEQKNSISLPRRKEQNDPVAQSSTSKKSPTTSTADLSERDNKAPLFFMSSFLLRARPPREALSLTHPSPSQFFSLSCFVASVALRLASSRSATRIWIPSAGVSARFSASFQGTSPWFVQELAP